jgi:Bacterial Ig domain
MRGRGVFAASLAALLLVTVASVARAGTDTGPAGIEVTTPSPAGFTSYGGMRIQAIGSSGPMNDELLGVADLTPATNRIEFNFSPPRFVPNGNSSSTAGNCVGNYSVGTEANPGANAITLTWDPSADTLTSRFVNATLNCTLVFRNFTQKLATAKGWTLTRALGELTDVNALRILVDDRQAGSKVTLTQATVDDAVALSPFDPGPGASNSWLGTSYDFATPNGFTLSGTMNLSGTFGSCGDTCALEIKFGHFTPPNRPPVVRAHAADATGNEGDTLTTDGSFVDPDGDPLTITGGPDGTVTDHGDGSWSWQFAPSRIDSGSVTVMASDGKGGTASDTFAWSAEPPPNRPPTVADHAADVTGHEGDTLQMHGSFADPDGDPLSVSGSGAGSLTDHGDGSWSWLYVPTDDASGSVSVTASDGKGGAVTDTFTWAADNVSPAIVSLTPDATTVLAGADVTWTAVATDPGIGDTFTWWFDGGAGVPGGLTTTYTTSYTACGTYSLDAKVADDDGGSDEATSDTTVTVVRAAALSPVDPGGVTVVQKGEVVPVKVQVGCGVEAWSDLQPTIELGYDGGTYPAESVSASDAPGLMRWNADRYQYNLRVPRRLGGTELARGDLLTVRVEPFGSAGGFLDIVLQIRK